MNEEIKTLDWAARELQMHEVTVLRLVKKGKLPGFFKIGGRWRVKVSILNNYLDGVA